MLLCSLQCVVRKSWPSGSPQFSNGEVIEGRIILVHDLTAEDCCYASYMVAALEVERAQFFTKDLPRCKVERWCKGIHRHAGSGL